MKKFFSKYFNTKKYNNSGFTLIELLVVIAIIGILSAIIYSPITNSLKKGRDTKRISEIKSIQAALFDFYDIYKGYPNSLSQLTASTSFILPKESNTGSSFDLKKYNYTVFGTSAGINNVKSNTGFHLYTHLETKHTSLDESANCYDVYSPSNATNFCIRQNSNNNLSALPFYPVNNSQAYFTDRSGDSDSVCANDVSRCIFSVTQSR